VSALGLRAPAEHAALLGNQAKAATLAASALEASDSPAFVAALGAQHRALAALGKAASIPIVTPELEELSRCSWASPRPARRCARASSGALIACSSSSYRRPV
jgi:hypothetical protein